MSTCMSILGELVCLFCSSIMHVHFKKTFRVGSNLSVQFRKSAIFVEIRKWDPTKIFEHEMKINPARNPFSYGIIFLDNPCSKSSKIPNLSECSKISSISKNFFKCAKNGILITCKILSFPNDY